VLLTAEDLEKNKEFEESGSLEHFKQLKGNLRWVPSRISIDKLGFFILILIDL
jgi:hypothetical protein